tara:strand:+ start:214 stop:474 length:261 start_codon:yes stop_codon:yes gene_type:complete
MKTIGELREAIYNLPDNAPLGVEIQTNGGDDLEFTCVDGLDVSSEKKYKYSDKEGVKFNGDFFSQYSELTEEIKSVNLIVTSNGKQ